MRIILLSALKIMTSTVSLAKKQRTHHYVTVKSFRDIAEEKAVVKNVKLTMTVT